MPTPLAFPIFHPSVKDLGATARKKRKGKIEKSNGEHTRKKS